METSLEIGCGGNPQPGYIHSDFRLHSGNRAFVDVVCDGKALSFRRGVFDSVLMFGVFEHFGIFEIQEVMLEIYRVLKPSGTFRFDVPDFDWFVERYLHPELLESGRTEEWVLKSIFGAQDGLGMVHQWGWNQKRLEDFLMKPNWPFSRIQFLSRQWRDPEENHLVYECVK